jgi:hypothetical protein
MRQSHTPPSTRLASTRPPLTQCPRCGSKLRDRRLVDPPEQLNQPSAALACVNRNCDAQYDQHGAFVRIDPEKVLRDGPQAN